VVLFAERERAPGTRAWRARLSLRGRDLRGGLRGRGGIGVPRGIVARGRGRPLLPLAFVAPVLRRIEPKLRALFARDVGAQHWFGTASGEGSLTLTGLATRTPPMPVTERTTFHCFSTTKPVTAVAVLQLVADGRVDLDVPLTTYLPDVPYRNRATVRQVLSHQAGLPNPLPLSWVHAEAEHAAFDSAAFLDRVLRDHPACRPAGRTARYSNIGFLLLGRLVEVVSERPYVDCVRERILDVVGSPRSDADAYLGFDLPQDRHAAGYLRRWSGANLFVSMLPDPARLRVPEGGWVRYRPFHLNGAPYGGLKGNVLGWAPLLEALARRDPRLLPAAMYDELFAPQSLASGKPTGHALAWFVGRVGRHDYVRHAGGGPGYGAEIRVYPALGAASALLANTTVLGDERLLDRIDVSWLPE
jgi:D-alanyl-D-alanine carboxypeptidase